MRVYLKVLFLIVVTFISCKETEKTKQVSVTVTNSLDFNRNEVVAIKQKALAKLLNGSSQKNIKVKKEGTEAYLTTQWIDNDSDGVNDEFLFKAQIPANSSVKYIILLDSINQPKETNVLTFSRLVPERTDDYTWENDKVAFRTYGPEAQRRIEQKEYGGTLSSGIDLWLKRVDYSIIDNWYAKNLETEGYYHIDHGEGYDPYHVGKSRGAGGIGVWENDSLHVSKNFTSYKTIATGPIRTIFELDYAPWSDYNIKETKRISLDLGSNFSKFEMRLASEKEVPNYTIGITKHAGKGESRLNNDAGIFRYWEPMDDSFIGEGIIMDADLVSTSIDYSSGTPDQSQLLIVTKPQVKPLTYYVGFAWQKSGQVVSMEGWDTLLEKQAKIIKNPLKVTIK